MTRYQTYKLSEEEKVQYNLLLEDEDIKKIPREVIKILFNRGIRTKDEIMLTLFGKVNNLCNLPMKDQKEFCERLSSALRYNEKIIVMGDYDTDGCMATCVMVLGLRTLGFRVDYYMNSRFKDGYGLKKSSVDRILEINSDTKIIITVDNGVKSFDAIDYCNDLGLDVLVTDHHNLATVLPNALAVIDPKREACPYPFKHLCGAGVAWKLMLSLCDYLNDSVSKSKINDLMWLVAIATVGDQVPLIGENRIIVKEVLNWFNDPNYLFRNIFIKRIKELLKIDKFDSDTIAFYISPMINAMGRIEGNPLQIVDSILSDDINTIDAIVQKMEDINKIRREQTSIQFEIAMKELEKDGFGEEEFKPKGILVHSDEFSEGIIGIVASRLTEKFNVPSIVLGRNEDGTYKGSCRSIEGINIEKVLEDLSYYLLNYGGHDMAAGLTISEDAIPLFKEHFMRCMGDVDDSVFENIVCIDLVRTVDKIDPSICSLIDELGPYGNSFRRPKMFLKNFKVDRLKSCKNKSNSFYVGKEGKTLRIVNSEGFVCIGFSASGKYKNLGEPEIISVVGRPSLNYFNGKCYPQFEIEKDYIIKSEI